MSERKKPIFGVISLVLMLGMMIVGIFMIAFEPPPQPVKEGESFAVAMEAVANIIATLLVIGTVSMVSAIIAGVSLIRKESRGPAAITLCLSISSLVIVLYAVIKL